MKVRLFMEQDRHQVICLWKEAGLITLQNDPDKDIDRKLKVDPDLLLVGVVEQQIVATIMGGYEGHRGWLNYLAVKKEYRNQRLARKLLEKID